MSAGDTLSSLAVRHGVGVGELKRANNILVDADLALRDKIRQDNQTKKKNKNRLCSKICGETVTRNSNNSQEQQLVEFWYILVQQELANCEQ